MISRNCFIKADYYLAFTPKTCVTCKTIKMFYRDVKLIMMICNLDF